MLVLNTFIAPCTTAIWWLEINFEPKQSCTIPTFQFLNVMLMVRSQGWSCCKWPHHYITQWRIHTSKLCGTCTLRMLLQYYMLTECKSTRVYATEIGELPTMLTWKSQGLTCLFVPASACRSLTLAYMQVCARKGHCVSACPNDRFERVRANLVGKNNSKGKEAANAMVPSSCPLLQLTGCRRLWLSPAPTARTTLRRLGEKW